MLKANKFVLNIIEFGYAIPFVSLPDSCYLKNNASSLKQENFVRGEIEELLLHGYIEELATVPFCCNPLTVVTGHKMRLVLDLRHVNKHVQYLPVKYDDWAMLSQVIAQHAYFISFDLTNAYHHLAILPSHRKYLGFSFLFPGSQGKKVLRHFQFNVLPFGLCSACHVFTKLTRPLVKHWRGELGINSFIYIDDGIGTFSSLSEAAKISLLMQHHLAQAGFLVNMGKSKWIPSQSLDWLGFHFNSVTMQISVSTKKLDKVKLTCHDLLKQKTVSSRQVAALTGQIIAMQRAIGPESRLMTRFLTY